MSIEIFNLYEELQSIKKILTENTAHQAQKTVPPSSLKTASSNKVKTNSSTPSPQPESVVEPVDPKTDKDNTSQKLQLDLLSELKIINEIFNQIFPIIYCEIIETKELIPLLQKLYTDITTTNRRCQQMIWTPLALEPHCEGIRKLLDQVSSIIERVKNKLSLALMSAELLEHLRKQTSEALTCTKTENESLETKLFLLLQEKYKADLLCIFKMHYLRELFRNRAELFPKMYEFYSKLNLRQLSYYNPHLQVTTAFSKGCCFAETIHWGISLQLNSKAPRPSTEIFEKLQTALKNSDPPPTWELQTGEQRVNKYIVTLQNAHKEIIAGLKKYQLSMLTDNTRLSLTKADAFQTGLLGWFSDDNRKFSLPYIDVIYIGLEGNRVGHAIGIAKIPAAKAGRPTYRMYDPDFGEWETDDAKCLLEYLKMHLQLINGTLEEDPFTQCQMFLLELPEMLEILKNLNIPFPIIPTRSAFDSLMTPTTGTPTLLQRLLSVPTVMPVPKHHQRYQGLKGAVQSQPQLQHKAAPAEVKEAKESKATAKPDSKSARPLTPHYALSRNRSQRAQPNSTRAARPQTAAPKTATPSTSHAPKSQISKQLSLLHPHPFRTVFR